MYTEEMPENLTISLILLELQKFVLEAYFGIKGLADALFGGVFLIATLLFILRSFGIFGETYASSFDITVSRVLYAHPITSSAMSQPEHESRSTPCLAETKLSEVWFEIHNFVCSDNDNEWAQEWCNYYK